MYKYYIKFTVKGIIKMASLILEFWFGKDLSLLNSDDYKHNPLLWFHASNETDDFIRTNFEIYLQKAENNELNDWSESAQSNLALVLLLDHLSRSIYRGTSLMFSNEVKCLKIAQEFIKNENLFNQLATIQKFFVFMALAHSEDISLSEKGLAGCIELQDQIANSQKANLTKYNKTLQVHNEILKKFGRYPQRNQLLNRKSTLEEIEFLKKYKNSFAKSVLPLKSSTSNNNSMEIKRDLYPSSRSPPQKLLFLHCSRQNSTKFKHIIDKTVKLIKKECNAHFIYLNGTHPFEDPTSYVKTEFNLIKHQKRAWYKSVNDGNNYEGIEESLVAVLAHVEQYGPYDGIIGIEQGSLLAGLIVKTNPGLFRYFISISAPKPTALKYKDLFSPERPIDFPSLHIYGKQDRIVSSFDSRYFGRCFLNSTCISYNGGYFAYYSWPVRDISDFINSQSVAHQTHKFNENQTFDVKIKKLDECLIRFNLNSLNFESLFKTDLGKNLFSSNKINEVSNFEEIYKNLEDEFKKVENNLDHINDKLLLVYMLIKLNSLKFNNSTEDASLDWILKLWIQIYIAEVEFRDYLLKNSIDSMFVSSQNWKELIHLCDLVYRLNMDEFLYEYLITLFNSVLVYDLRLHDEMNSTYYMPELTSSKYLDKYEKMRNEFKFGFADFDEDHDGNCMSKLSKFMPRINSSKDKSCKIGKECANQLNSFRHIIQEMKPDEFLKAKILSYNHYKKILTTLCFTLDAF